MSLVMIILVRILGFFLSIKFSSSFYSFLWFLRYRLHHLDRWRGLIQHLNIRFSRSIFWKWMGCLVSISTTPCCHFFFLRKKKTGLVFIKCFHDGTHIFALFPKYACYIYIYISFWNNRLQIWIVFQSSIF